MAFSATRHKSRWIISSIFFFLSVFRSTSYWSFTVLAFPDPEAGLSPWLLLSSLKHWPLTILEILLTTLMPLQGFCQPVSGGCQGHLWFTLRWEFTPNLTHPLAKALGGVTYQLLNLASLGVGPTANHPLT